jgi:DNA-binding CsgD family transcriptional regulator
MPILGIWQNAADFSLALGMQHPLDSSSDAGLGRFILDLYREAQEESVDQFPRSVFARLKSHIEFDSCGIATFYLSAQKGLSLISQLALNVVPNKHALRAEFVGAESHDPNAGLRSRDPLFTKAVRQTGKSHRLSWDEITGTALREYSSRSEGVNALAIATTSREQTVSSFSLWRAKKKSCFSLQDEVLADVVLPHITQAISINRKLTANAFVGNHRQAGAIIADPQGVIHHIDDFALILLRREYPGWLSTWLPDDLFAALAANSAQRHVGRNIVATLRRQANVFLIAVEARQPGEKLTPAELRVVSAVVKHGTYKEAARQLGVSPATIRNQLHSIYVKLGIRGKSDLARTFRDAD